MKKLKPSALHATSTWRILAAFGVILAIFAVANVSTYYEVRRIQEDSQATVENMLISIELVSRIRWDINRERVLVDEHIFEREAVDLDRIEGEIRGIEADFQVTAAAYEPLTTFAGERETWDRLKRAVAARRGPIAKALTLSRNDQDDAARAAVISSVNDFELIDALAESLIQINHTAAEDTLVRIHNARHHVSAIHVFSFLGGAIVSLIAAIGFARVLHRRERELADAGVRLERQNHDLDAFAGRVAHDLRGPLTSISLSASQLSERSPDDPASHRLRRGVDRMETLIRDLLELSRIEAPKSATAQAADVIHGVEEDIARDIQNAAGSLHVAVEPAPVLCSEGLLRQAVWNLAENAVKYRRPDVPLQLDISGRGVGGSYELTISDNGAGMSPDEAERAFEPFFRGERTRSTPGTGLGLSIVKRVVEASGGTISLDSTVGRGTKFTIHLPLA
jgi:signal transduction histidine kinase